MEGGKLWEELEEFKGEMAQLREQMKEVMKLVSSPLLSSFLPPPQMGVQGTAAAVMVAYGDRGPTVRRDGGGRGRGGAVGGGREG